MKKQPHIFPAFLVLAFLHLSCSEFQKNSYSNLADSGRGQNDWIPFFLTDNEEIRNQVHDVLECHDLDTNETWGYFSVDDENIIFGLTDSPTRTYSMEKAGKRLAKLGCAADFGARKGIAGDGVSYFLLHDAEQSRFYFYGQFRQRGN